MPVVAIPGACKDCNALIGLLRRQLRHYRSFHYKHAESVRAVAKAGAARITKRAKKVLNVVEAAKQRIRARARDVKQKIGSIMLLNCPWKV